MSISASASQSSMDAENNKLTQAALAYHRARNTAVFTAVLLAMTKLPGMRERSTVISSVTASAR